MSNSRPESITLRSAQASELGAIEALLTAADLPLAGVRDHVAGFHVAESDGRLVAGAAIESYPPSGLLRSVAVSEAHRGTGLGARLVEHVIAEARRADLRRLYLLTTTADRWFPRFGFRIVPRASLPPELSASEELRGACPDTAVCMLLELDAAG